MLQCGRGRLAAEPAKDRFGLVEIDGLQCGRRGPVASEPAPVAARSLGIARFDVAAVLGPRKPAIDPVPAYADNILQIGRGRLAAET